ncbi:MAG: glycosyltransferase [Simkaniaceae bacterium]|nr:glycosyltransferase [Simkaniaceae bacterium]
MKRALVADWLVDFGGAERTFKAMCHALPGDIYTLFGNLPPGARASFLQKVPLVKRLYKLLTPLMPRAIESLDFREYDVVISSSFAFAKGAITTSDQIHICYCHTPLRSAWDLYFDLLDVSGWKRPFLKWFMPKIRQWDVASSHRVDYWIANSHYIARRIEKTYGKKVDAVIYPPVEIEKFPLCKAKENYYIVVSRLVPHKRIDLIAQAFAQMPDKKLIIVGDGPERERIKGYCGKNVEYLGYIDDTKELLGRARAMIFAAREDFGITLLEAQSCGTPVIAFRKGGALETVINGKTGIFFDKQSSLSIIEAVKHFETLKFDPETIHNWARRFNRPRFEKQLKDFVDACLCSRRGNRLPPVAAVPQELAETISASQFHALSSHADALSL